MICLRVLIGLLLLLSSIQPIKAQERSVIDLRDTDLNKPFELTGQWDFYWKQLITSSEGLAPSKSKVIPPHDWAEETLEGERLSAEGYATYAVRLILPSESPQLGMYIPHAFSSYKVIVNDSLVWESGKVGVSKEEYRGYREPKVVSLKEFKIQTLDILIQVANFDHYNAGLYYPLELDAYSNLTRKIRTNQGISFF